MNLADLELIASYDEWDAGDIADVKAHLPELLNVARKAEKAVPRCGGTAGPARCKALAEALKPLQTEDC